MTSVYGVTFVGAREQMLSRLKDIEALAHVSLDAKHDMAVYLARLTLSSLGEIFEGAQ